ncbi:MAG: LLM class flavin-dependent oxidoreductase [Mycolicibacterium rufum]|nr:LLM class flavin-dependent oxidoreductase [Mycolicibacterium rufum]
MTTPLDPKIPPRVGCVYRPQFAPERIAEAAAVADAAGLDDLWLWEDCFLAGGISGACLALSNSSRLSVGVGVLPAPMRNVALTAMEIATLVRAFPGRVRIGVGHGVQDWMAQVGAKVASPMTLLHEYISCLTALLRGDEVTFDGRYVHLEKVRLDWPPDVSTEILAAAVGPKTLRLSGQLADGTVITGGTTPDALRSAVEHIRAGRESRSRPQPHAVVTYLLSATGPRAQQDLDEEIAHWGFDPLADVGVAGCAEDIALGAQRWIDAGADTVVFQPRADAVIEDFVEFVGTQVRPRLHRGDC